MYITTKKVQPMPTINGNIVDALFNGTEIQPETIVPIEPFYRTVTHKVDEVTTNYCTRDMYLNCCATIHQCAVAHPDPASEYETFRIPKRTHGFREINAPKIELKTDQKMVASSLGILGVLYHDSAWAYTPGRSVVKAMQEHQKNKSRWFLKIDLHDFFGSCSPEFIKQCLLDIYPFAYYKETESELTEQLIHDIIHIACLNGGLPQGTPLSPTLVNLIMVGYDYEINRLLAVSGARYGDMEMQRYVYTRYADDIIISAKNKFDYKLLTDKLKNLFRNTPLTINDEKTRFGSSSGRNWNLGVMLNKDNKLTVGYRKKHEIKALVNNYCIDKINNSPWSLDDLYYIQGQLSWLQNVEPDYYTGILRYWKNKYTIQVDESIRLDIKNY